MESTEVIARRCSVKKVFLEISKNSQQNTCARGSFLIKLQISARPEQNIVVMSNWSKTFQTFWSHSSVFLLEKQPEKLNFQSFLFLKDPLEATFNETRAPTSRKYVSEQGIVIPNWSKAFQIFGWTPPFFL